MWHLYLSCTTDPPSVTRLLYQLRALSIRQHKRKIFGTASGSVATEADRQKGEGEINSLSNKGNGVEEWREQIREGVRQSDPEQFPAAS